MCSGSLREANAKSFSRFEVEVCRRNEPESFSIPQIGQGSSNVWLDHRARRADEAFDSATEPSGNPEEVDMGFRAR